MPGKKTSVTTRKKRPAASRAEDAGGVITVTSAPGKGTSFEVFLPRHAGD